MSHDRGCCCGREPYDYDDCRDPKCCKKWSNSPWAPTEVVKMEAKMTAKVSWDILREAVAVMQKAEKEYDVRMKMTVWKKGIEIEARHGEAHLANILAWHSLERTNPEMIFRTIDFIARKVKELYGGCI